MYLTKTKGFQVSGSKQTFAFLALLLCGGCVATSTTIIKGTLPTVESSKPRNMFYAGAAKVDITPPPGFPMGGHSKIGQVSRGHWLRLNARSLYIEAPDGSKLVLLATDLWSMPAGLANRVTTIVGNNAPEKCKLNREQIIFSATHTHQSPGNFSSSSLYNALGSNKGGFDQDLFEFLAQRLAKAIRNSCGTAEPARLDFSTTQVKGLARNRSIEAFLKNPKSDIERIFKEGINLPKGPLPPKYNWDDRSYHAVDSTLQTLWLKSMHSPSRVIGVGAFFATHPTALNHYAEVYSSDLFGVASIAVEQKISTVSKVQDPVVAIFNGAEGDVSPAWVYQDRPDVLRLGNILGNAIWETKNDNHQIHEGAVIKGHFATKPLADQYTFYLDKKLVTFKEATGTLAALAGAEDGRTSDFWIDPRCSEGMSVNYTEGQGTKEAGWFCKNIAFPIANCVQQSYSAPKNVPIGIYQLGPIVFATLPGEFTTVMGNRIRKDLANKFKVPEKKVILVGLSNEYVSYFTTPEEYDAQHYEGGSTLYGKASGELLRDNMKDLSKALTKEIPTSNIKEYNYDVGKTKTFKPSDLSNMSPGELMNSIKKTMYLGRDIWLDIRSYCWDGLAPTVAEVESNNWEGTPSVAIEVKEPEKHWLPLTNNGVLEDDQGLNFVIQLSESQNTQSKWCAFWLPPSGLKETSPLRFKVTGYNTTIRHTSPSFYLGQDY